MDRKRLNVELQTKPLFHLYIVFNPLFYSSFLINISIRAGGGDPSLCELWHDGNTDHVLLLGVSDPVNCSGSALASKGRIFI